MRAVWLVAACLLVAGCASQQPAPSPDGNDTGGEDPYTDGSTGGATGGEENTTTDGTDDSETANETTEEEPMQVTSPAFDENATIPEKHTRDGANVSPRLEVTGVPEAAQTLAVIVDDPDAPQEDPWVHWLLWNAPAEADAIPEGYPPSGDGKAFNGAEQGTTDFGTVKYDGPAPPPTHDAHRYRFTVHALDTTLDLEPGANRSQLESAMDGHVLERDRLTGLYER